MKSYVVVCLAALLVYCSLAQDIDSINREARAAPKAKSSNVILLENEKTGQDIMLVPAKPKREAFPFADEDDTARNRREAFPIEEDSPIKREAYPYPYPYPQDE